MNMAMWFLLGALCGAAVCAAVWRRAERVADVEKSPRPVETDGTEWVQTRNFLYYDGTEMPVMKENVNEQ